MIRRLLQWLSPLCKHHWVRHETKDKTWETCTWCRESR